MGIGMGISVRAEPAGLDSACRSGILLAAHALYGSALMMQAAFDFFLVPAALVAAGWMRARCRRAESETKACRTQFQATFEQAAVGIAHVALDGRWLRVNDKICQIVGYSREELMQSTFQQITHADDLDADLESMRLMLGGEIGPLSTTKRYVHKSGAIVWIRLTVSVTSKADGKPDYFIAVIEDITEAHQAEAQLRKLKLQTDTLMEQQVIAQTVLALAHELNQPLNSAGCYSEAAMRLIAADSPDKQKLGEVLRLGVTEIQRAGAVMRNLIRNVHHTRQAAETFELGDALREAIRMFQTELYEAEVHVDLSCKPLQVKACRLGLEKVLMNLLWNAHQAGAVRIEIRVGEIQGMAVVSVIDGGPGVPCEIVDKLFEPFFTTKSNGVGMGLAISRALIEGGGGKLWYDPIDGQSAFHFSIRQVAAVGRERRIRYRDRREINRRVTVRKAGVGTWSSENGERRRCPN